MLQRAVADAEADAALMPRWLQLLDRAEALQASVAKAIEHRDATKPAAIQDWKGALSRARAALDELEASLEPVEAP